MTGLLTTMCCYLCTTLVEFILPYTYNQEFHCWRHPKLNALLKSWCCEQEWDTHHKACMHTSAKRWWQLP